MEKEFIIRTSDRWGAYCVLTSKYVVLYEGTLADCYAFIKLTEEGYDIVV